MSSITEEEGDIFVGAVNFLRAIGLGPQQPKSVEAQEKQETPEPKPEPPKTKYCSCSTNPHYQAPPEVPLKLQDEVEARCGGKWSKAIVTKVHKAGEDHSKWLYDVQYTGKDVPLVGVRLRRCLIREPKGESDFKLFCTACGLPPISTKGFKSFKAGKGDMTFWANPEVLYGLLSGFVFIC